MRLKWSKYASIKYDEQIGYIALRNPSAAENIADKIDEALDKIVTFPEMGRKGRLPNSFEHVVNATPLIIVYGIQNGIIVVFNILHTSQDYP